MLSTHLVVIQMLFHRYVCIPPSTHTHKEAQKCLVLHFWLFWIMKNCMQYSVRKQLEKINNVIHIATLLHNKGNEIPSLPHLMPLFIVLTQPCTKYCHLYFASVTTSESLLSSSLRKKKKRRKYLWRIMKSMRRSELFIKRK